MPVRVHLAGPLAPFAAGRGEVELPGRFATVGEALEALVQTLGGSPSRRRLADHGLRLGAGLEAQRQ